MSKLEDLVSPLELCKKIPQGYFEDSALVRSGDGTAIWRRGGKCYLHQLRCGTKMFPAPTQAEIMAELPKYDENEKTLACIPDFPNESGEAVFGAAWTVGYTKNSSVTDKNPATAALKLWLELKGIEA